MDPERTPVIAAVGQAIERDEIVTAVELTARAAEGALGAVDGLRERIQRVSVIDIIFSPVSGRPASELAERLGIVGAQHEVTTPGGNMPQWMIARAARDIAEGGLGTTLIAGGEATRSMRAADPDSDFMRTVGERGDDSEPDPRVGSSVDGLIGEAELAVRLFRATDVYPLFEAALAHKEGRSFEEQRAHLGPLMSSFSQVASEHPFAWFREALSPDALSRVSAENRLISEPYPKKMNAFPNVDQAAAVVVTSLATARALGINEGCLFIWSAATNAEPTTAARPDLWDAPALRAASKAALDAAGVTADELDLIDLYSCFPIAVQAGATGLGVGLDDPRKLTVTGGLPFFGGPGNNYSLHAVATMADRLRETGGLGYVGANGGFLSKHSIGVYGTKPPPQGFRAAETSAEQTRIDASALPVALPSDGAEGLAEVAASTVIYARDGGIEDAPVIATLEDGRRVVARAEESLRSSLVATNLTGSRVRVGGDPLRYVPV